jgi:hypothetical protein
MNEVLPVSGVLLEQFFYCGAIVSYDRFKCRLYVFGMDGIESWQVISGQ